MAFAPFLGVSVKTLQDWERDRRAPKYPVKSLLNIAANHPEVFTNQRLNKI
jgi:putative transcriptional regulator